MTAKMKWDDECVDLCYAINETFPGIQTTASCCGHGTQPYRILFKAKNLEVLPSLLFWFNGSQTIKKEWSVIVYTNPEGRRSVNFCIEGPIGQQAYKDALHIAQCIRKGGLKG